MKMKSKTKIIKSIEAAIGNLLISSIKKVKTIRTHNYDYNNRAKELQGTEKYLVCLDHQAIATSYLVCVSKKTGQIVFCGPMGDEG